MEAVRQHERELAAYALERLGDIESLSLYGPGPEERGGVLAFNLPGIHPHDLADLLDDEGIAIRAGHHCAQPLVESLGVAATARVSFYLYNTRQEVDALVEAIRRARKVFA
jgi:cysteine desulfurase/selenocysteine lyase